jgi:hypothetical protein
VFDALVWLANNAVYYYTAGASRPTLQSQQAWAQKQQELAALQSNAHPSGDCMYCYKTFTRAKPDHLVKHFVDGKCKGAPPEVREELLKLTAEGAPTAVLPSTALTSTAAPTSSGNSSATSGSKRSSSMTDHYGSSKPVTDEEARMLDHLLLRAMVDCGISFRLLSNPFFLDWLDRATSQRYTAAGK